MYAAAAKPSRAQVDGSGTPTMVTVTWPELLSPFWMERGPEDAMLRTV